MSVILEQVRSANGSPRGRALREHAAALGIVEGKRVAMGLPDFAKSGAPAKHIATAARLGLGTNDPARIDHQVLTLT